ncbi:hypothetical protein ACS8YF_14590 [Salinisphaera sp. SWV1]|uniref:hypothetical protein n=1 Tax=Salinisphaera sp. SWV1 TaxID=3454139 RepID=UPI003F82B8CD
MHNQRRRGVEKDRRRGVYFKRGDAKVYVTGAGFAADRGYRGEDTLKSLEDFWRAYFQRSHARLAGWGQPELMTGLQ